MTSCYSIDYGSPHGPLLVRAKTAHGALRLVRLQGVRLPPTARARPISDAERREILLGAGLEVRRCS